jgi:radical SAM superfamily enzyme YgiQ (UPF0313 family)
MWRSTVQQVLDYEGPVYRPPSEADSLILQATIGCSWNHCTYCAMYRHKQYRERPLEDLVDEIRVVRDHVAEGRLPPVRRVFVGDGDALNVPTDRWERLLEEVNKHLPRVTRISCYATAQNLMNKSAQELATLRQLGLRLLYIGPESGDDQVLKTIAKGATFADHVEAARRATEAGMEQSLIFLLGIAGPERGPIHARASGKLTTKMDPRYVSLLTVTVVPQTPLSTLAARGKFAVPRVPDLLSEISAFLEEAEPTKCVFRSNHASNYLPLAGQLPRDSERLLSEIEEARRGERALRPEWARGL